MKSKINLSLDNLVNEEDVIQTLIKTALKNNSFVTLVKVISVDINNLTVDVMPLILGETAEGEKIEANVIYNIKYVRIQSGDSAIIIDPSEGDIGMALVCDRDISTIKKTKQEAMPASNRIHSLPDSIYLGGVLNRTPKQYIKFTQDGIEIYSPSLITVTSPKVNVNADNLTATVLESTSIKSGVSIALTAPTIALNGALTANKLDGKGTAQINMPLNSNEDISAKGISLVNHTHSDVQSGSSSTGKPQ
ncbi:Gp138 family membrane-puncturing spike protein [Orbaceae bacterium ac157xtp]